MKFVFPEIEYVFETDGKSVPSLVIENPSLLLRLLSDLTEQMQGNDGMAVLSADDKILPIEKNAEILDRFVPFELNQKTLLTKAAAVLEKEALAGENYLRSVSLLSEVRTYLEKLAFDALPGSVVFPKLELSSLIKAAGLTFQTEKTCLSEQLLDYFELVTELERKKLFFTLNLRSFLSDEETILFLDTVLLHDYNIFMIEAADHPRLPQETRVIVDRDLCVIT